jgi:hypothetical protein
MEAIIQDETTLWTEGMKALRELGFTVYPKEHVAYFGRFYVRRMFHVDAEVTHSRETGMWKIEFDYDYGQDAFKVSMTKTINRRGLKTLMDDWRETYKEFQKKYAAELKIIHNIFSSNND